MTSPAGSRQPPRPRRASGRAAAGTGSARAPSRRRSPRPPARTSPARGRSARSRPAPASPRPPARTRRPSPARRRRSARRTECGRPSAGRAGPPSATAPVARAREQRPRPERPREVRLLGAHRVARQEDRGQVGAGQHRDHADQRRGRVQPRVDRVAGRVADPTRPDAIPPSTAPKKNGISTDAGANSAPSTRASLIVAAWPRSANAAPRKMIPIAARKSGIVQRREDRPERRRERRPDDHQHEDQPHVVGLPDGRHRALDHAPHPAPARRAARREVPEARRRSRRSRAPRTRRSPSTMKPTQTSATSTDLRSPGGQPAQQPRDRNAQRHVDGDEHDVADHEPVGLRDGLLGAHHLVDDPRLAADLGRDPARDQRDERQRARRPSPRGRTRSTPAAAVAQPGDEEERAEQRETGPDADHRLEREADDVDRRAVLGGTASRPTTSSSGRASPGSRAASGSRSRSGPRRATRRRSRRA